MKLHADITVHGLVQGVKFRFSARIVAEHMGVFGYAKNQDDNTVFIEAEGEEEKLERFIVWCHRGPEDARVEKVNVVRCDELRNYETFESIRGK